MPVNSKDAVVFTNGLLHVDFAKTCHGLLRGSSRFNVKGVIDHVHAGKDAGEAMDGRPLGVSVYSSLSDFLEVNETPPVFVVGVAFSGGGLPESCRDEILEAIRNGMDVVSGLHQFIGDDEEFALLAQTSGSTLTDIRRPRPTSELRFWTGEVLDIRATVVPVLGTDCAVGKRTTSRFLWEACNAVGMKTEMIYTGQTGWMQGYTHGFIFDATPNDFVSGEIERVILECERESAPDLILIEGQGSLRNPSGPCGSEFILSGHAVGVILQHDPARRYFVHQEEIGMRVPRVEDEIELIRMFGVETIAVTLNGQGWPENRMIRYQSTLRDRLHIPVVRPIEEGVAELVPVLRSLIAI